MLTDRRIPDDRQSQRLQRDREIREPHLARVAEDPLDGAGVVVDFHDEVLAARSDDAVVRRVVDHRVVVEPVDCVLNKWGGILTARQDVVGEDGHDETVGTMGWAPENIQLVLDVADVEHLEVPDENKVAYLTQTTVSVDDCERVVAALKRRFPNIQGPPRSDICYATSNRQAAVRALAPEVDLVLVVGSQTSANSNRLAEICVDMGKPSYLIDTAAAIQKSWLSGVETILLTAGASAPESLVQGVIDRLIELGVDSVTELPGEPESLTFALPPELRSN